LSLGDKLIAASENLPGRFIEQKDGTFLLEAKIAERKVLVQKKTLMYKAHLRVDDQKKVVRFFEILKETAFGMSSGGDAMDISPGFGIKMETYKVAGKAREGSIKEQSKLFGKEYKYSFDWANVRKTVEEKAREAGYSLSVVLNERSI